MSDGEQGIQSGNNESLAMNDPIMEGLQQPMKMEGVAKETSQFGEQSKVEAQGSTTSPPNNPPVAAPVNQIAPISANGQQTSARSSPNADVPADGLVNTQPAAEAMSNSPGLPPAEAVGPDQESQAEEDQFEEEFGKPLGIPEPEINPLDAAENFLRQAPGRMRLY